MEFAELDRLLSDCIGKAVFWDNGSTLVNINGAANTQATSIGVEYLSDRDELCLHGVVAALDRRRLASSAMELLRANLFGMDTGGYAALAYDEEDEEVILWDKLALAETSADALEERFYGFYLALVFWTRKFSFEMTAQKPDGRKRVVKKPTRR